MSGNSSNMYWTVRSKYYVTTTIIPPSLPTPPSTPSELYAVSQSKQSGRGWYKDVTPKWAHRDPRFKSHYKYQHPMPVQQPSGHSSAESYGYFTASPHVGPESYLVNNNKRPSEEQPIPTTLPLKKQKVCPEAEVHCEQKPVAGNYDLSALGNTNTTNVRDLLAKMVATGLIQDVKKEKVIKTENEKVQPKQDGNLVHEVDLLNPDSLRTKQPGLIARLYGGNQCSNCSTRFPVNESKQYSEHLDWHFRQNRRARESRRRRGESRSWYHSKSDWYQSEEIEDSEKKQQNWFETMAQQKRCIAKSEDVPSVVAGKLTNDNCGICGDRFDTFYNEDDDEWHLKNAVCLDSRNYHPTCLEHQKVNSELKFEVVGESTVKYEKVNEIAGVTNIMEDSDVICVETPVEVIVVIDDEDEDETATERDNSLAKVKQEPIDSV